MKDQQTVILQMLKEIHEVCTQNDIKYFAAAGTLLGACRHQGFIPWDDDADIWMPLDQYLKFREVCQTQLPPNRMLRSPELQEEYWHHLAHYTATDTTCFHRCEAYLQDMDAGEVIDIFILDPIADGEEDAYRKDLALYASVLSYGYVAGERFEPDYDEFVYYNKLLKKKSKKEVHALLEAKLASHFSDDGENYICRYVAYPSLFKRKSFEEAIPVPFEDGTLCVPSGAHDCLNSVYGDDWMLMPTNPPMIKHNTASSLEVPCKEAIEYFKPSSSPKRLWKEEILRRHIALKLAPQLHWLSDERTLLRNKVKELELEYYMNEPENKQAFAEAYEAKDGYALWDALEPFIAYQLDADVIGRRSYSNSRRFFSPKPLNIDACYYEGMICALLNKEKLDQAWRLIEMWDKTGKEVTPYMSDVRDAIIVFRDAMDDHQKGKYDEGLTKCEQLLEKFPTVNTFNQILCLTLNAKFHKTGDKDTLVALKRAADNALSFLPEEGFYMKFQAEYTEATEGLEAATPLYIEAAEHTINGVALYSIKKKIGYSPRWHHESFWAEMAGLEPYEKQEEPLGVLDGLLDYQERMYVLLCELVDICNENNISYSLSKKTASAFFEYNKIPTSASFFAILVSGKDLKRLKKIIDEHNKDKRTTTYRNGRIIPTMKAFNYMDTESLLINLRHGVPEGDMGMRVIVMNRTAPNGFNYLEKNIGQTLRNMRGKDLVTKSFAGRDWRVPATFSKSLEAYYTNKSVNGDKQATNPYYVMSTKISYSDFYKSNVTFVDAERYKKTLKEIHFKDLLKKAIFAHMDIEYRELQFAVHLKEISLNLLPRKEEILVLYEQRNFKKLAEILRDYIELLDNARSGKRMKFDSDIYEVAKATRAYLAKRSQA